MSRLYPDRPHVGVLAIVRHADRFILVQRARPPAQGKWGFPGGGQEIGETIIEAAVRELREETGVEAEPLHILTALDAIDREGERIRFHYTLVAVLLDWKSGDPVAADDAAAAGWFTAAEAVKLHTNDRVGDLMRLALAQS